LTVLKHYPMNNLYSVTRSLFLSALFLISLQVLGQQSVSIGTTEIKSNAVLYLLGTGSQGLIIPVTANPSGITPAAGMVVFNSSDQKVYFCDGTNWAPINGGVGSTDSQTLTISGNTITISNGNSQNIAGTAPSTIGQILTWDGTKWTSSSGVNAPAINQVLQWNGTSWVPTTLASGGTVTNVATGTGLTGGPIATTGTIALANTAVTAGSYGSATSIPQLTIDAQGRITAAASLNILNANTTTTGLLSNTDWNTFNNKLSTIPTLGGDISGTLGAVTVDRIKNIAVSVNAPTTGQILQYNGTQWAPATLALGGTVTTVTGTLPISVSNNTTTPIVSISQAGLTTNGYLSSADWVTFNSKLSNPMTTAGDIIYGTASGVPTRLATGTGFLRGGATPTYSAVNLASADVTGTLPVTNGGTGGTTAAGARSNLGLGTLATLSGVSTTEITDGTIAAADLSSMSATNGQILKYNGTAWVAATDDVGAGATPTLANGQILVGDGTTNSAAALSGDATLSAGVLTIGSGAITAAKILDGTITAADLSSMGATSGQVMQYNGTAWVPATSSGLSSTLNNGNIFVGNATNVATGVAMSGDATISNTGALTLANSSAARTNLGLGSLATASAITSSEITDATITAADLGVGSVNLASTDVTGTLPLTLGGTGATTAVGARTSLGLGSLATASTVTSTEITDATITAADLGVGSVDLSTPDVTGTLPLTLGGTGATTAANARTNLGLGTLATLSGVSTTEITDGTIAAADLSSMSATNGQILKYNGTAWVAAADDVGGGATPTLANGQILIGNGTTNSAAALSGDATLAAGVITIGTNAVTSLKIDDGTITAADLSNMGASAGQVMQYNGTAWVPATGSGLSSTLNNGNIFVGNATNVATGVTLSGDATISNTGALTLTNSSSTRTNLGLGSLATASAVTSSEITDATITAADLGVGSVNLASTDVTGTLPLTLGGTGATTAAGARTSLGLGSLATLSAVTSTEITDATITSADLGTGSVDLATTDVTGTLPLTNGGTGATTATAARTNLGLGSLATLSAVSTTEITDGTIATADLAAGSVSGGLGGVIADGTINAADISTMSATNGQVLQFNGSLWAPATIGGGVTTLDGLTDVTVTTLSGGQVLVNNGSGQFANVSMSGDATLSNTGALTLAASSVSGGSGGVITDASITNADINASAAIAGSKITPAFGSQAISTTGTLSSGATTVTGLTVSGTGTTLNTVSYTWPGAQGGVGTVLTNNGSGALTWTSATTGWSLAGNSASGVDYLGTNNGQDLDIRTNGTNRMTIRASNGNVGINNTSPAQPLDVTGNVRFTGALMPAGNSGSAGQVLTSAGVGVAPTWSNGMSNPLTTNGDIIYGVGSTPTRLAAGTGFLRGGAVPSYSAINLASTDVTGTLPIANGGTGATTPSAALTSLGALGNSLTDGNIFVGSAGNLATSVPMSGDATISNTGALAIATGVIVNADINTSAAIAGTKITPAFGTQNISTTGTLTSGNSTTFGAATITWPGANAAGFLSNNGAGSLSWVSALTTTLANGNIYVGNGGVATPTVMSGDATLSAAGVLTIAAGAISGGTIGDITDATITAADLAVGAVDLTTTDVTGILPVALGGTNSSATPTNGGVGFGTGTAHAYTAAGTSGQLLQSNGAAAPTWVNAPATITASNGLTKTVNDITLGGTLTSNRTITSGGFDLFFDGAGSLAIGTNASASKLDVEGGVAIGATYSGTTAAPTNGLIVEGIVGIGTSAPTASSGVTLNLPLAATIKDGIVINNNYNSTGSKAGLFSTVSPDGSGTRYGLNTIAYSGTTGTLYGIANTISHTGTSGTLYGTNQSITNATTNAAVVYGDYTTITNNGAGNTFGMRADVNKPALTAGEVYGLSIEASNNGTANSYLLYGNSNGTTTGTEYGLYVTGEDQNYFSQKVGIGVSAPINRLDVEGGAVIGAAYSGTNTAPANGLLVEGSVSIGVTTATRKLNVSGDIDASGGIYLGSVEYFQDGGASEIMTNSDIRPVTNSGYNLGTTTYRWNTVYATNGTISTSDRRLKKNIKSLNYGLADLMKLRPVSFEWKDKEGMRKLGLIAQEVQQILPEVVDEPKEGYLGVFYADLVPVTVKAIQEQQAIIEKQQAEIDALKAQLGQLDSFKAELENLKARVGAEARNTKKRK
jgi:hypothetical protein